MGQRREDGHRADGRAHGLYHRVDRWTEHPWGRRRREIPPMGEWLRPQPAGPGAVAEAALLLYKRDAGTSWTEMITDTDLLFVN